MHVIITHSIAARAVLRVPHTVLHAPLLRAQVLGPKPTLQGQFSR